MIDPKTQVHLYLIRHGQSHMNLNPHLVGGKSANAPLSQAGEDQCTALYKYLQTNKINFHTAYSSHLLRAKMTASIALGPDAPVIIIDKRLVEYSAGDWEGKPRQEVQTQEVMQQMSEMGIDFQPPGGESQRQVAQRVISWLQDEIIGNQKLHESGKQVNVAVFSHGLAIKCLLHQILGLHSHLIWRLEIDNCSVSKLVFNSRGWWPKYINRIPY